jgi:hypothetical protein
MQSHGGVLFAQVLFKTYGKDLMIAGIFKLLWSCFVILGAYYFTRSILECIRTLEGLQTYAVSCLCMWTVECSCLLHNVISPDVDTGNMVTVCSLHSVLACAPVGPFLSFVLCTVHKRANI